MKISIFKSTQIISVYFFVIFFPKMLSAQGAKTVLLSGKIMDNRSKEVLPGASVFVVESNKGVVTNANGIFEIPVNAGDVTVKIRYIGYINKEVKIRVNSDFYTQFFIESDENLLNEVKVSYRIEDPKERVKRSEVSVERISMREAKQLPSIMGEVDIIKIFQLKPGVKSGPEGTAGFYVRGGSNDQNLILVDKAPVYNPNHLFGFFSVFSAEAIEDVTLYKAGFPSKYGGRLSSVLDVKVREAKADTFRIEGGVGLISSRINLNIPIIKDKLSIMLTGRRTYADVFTEGINRINRNNKDFTNIPRYYFYDFNGNIQYDINHKNKLSLSNYIGNDVFNFQNQNFGTLFSWGNRSTTLKLQTKLSQNLQSEHAIYQSAYQYKINSRFGGSNLSLGSNISDIGFISDWKYHKDNSKFSFNWGANLMDHKFSIGDFGINTGVLNLQQGIRKNGQELGVYLTTDYEISARLALQIGLRNSGFFTDNIYSNGVEPRLMLNYKVEENKSIKFSYARMYQYLHLVTTSTASLPTDIWYPTTPKVSPQFSDQIAIASHNSIFDGNYFFSVEAYYKWIGNAIDFKDGAQLFGNPNLEDEFVFGKGWAYGIETYVEKKLGKTRGWIGYTLSWSYREFDEINNGKPFFPRFDQRHNVSIVIMHQLSKRWSLSSTWFYGTGNFASIASGRVAFQDILPSQIDAIPDYSGRNDFQMPPTHRLDLGAVFKLKSRRGESDLTFSIYNAYSRRNPFFLRYQEIENEQGEVTGFRPSLVSLFPIIPSITYNFKF